MHQVQVSKGIVESHSRTGEGSQLMTLLKYYQVAPGGTVVVAVPVPLAQLDALSSSSQDEQQALVRTWYQSASSWSARLLYSVLRADIRVQCGEIHLLVTI
ncbi:hypothetical protein Pmar_PMAR001941 [Perkinsus marinus ATCC 50983]|uniref:Uncharacterized protein n=1 Tax=Perkinsus marinus (strain ATCC 50983 / TXsc) TaxID=423536 RepID=C5KJ26_PERM5|nr:hypothetical protein Pmar_PMAR001941 [Perkinsus marinus ATCC 50983]EER15519.1 hypothetical protein Pmar_PMAR001941 [Perkinsus marinus ATCC 50983]|eukprot:XP_002783723.1 hypothetical protein Pmar_PMAR001941 [Perkinsus marinus ATCC 50983]